jgi:hypothetical protein
MRPFPPVPPPTEGFSGSFISHKQRKQRLNSEKFETILMTTFQTATKTRGETELLALVHSVGEFGWSDKFLRNKILGTVPHLAIERLTGEF